MMYFRTTMGGDQLFYKWSSGTSPMYLVSIPRITNGMRQIPGNFYDSEYSVKEFINSIDRNVLKNSPFLR